MSTKTTKRKRATTPAAIETDGAPIASALDVSAAEPSVAEKPVAEKPVVGEATVSLFSNSTVKDAAALRDTLLQVLDEQGPVAIDAKSVERIDTAIVQILCAFVRDRAARNLAVNWRGTPQPLRDAARLLGVGSLLALPSQASEA